MTNTVERVEVVLPGKVEPEGLQFHRGPVPAPAAGQVVVAMEATGVSFAEQQMRRGRYYDQPPFPSSPATTWSARCWPSVRASARRCSASGSPP